MTSKVNEEMKELAELVHAQGNALAALLAVIDEEYGEQIGRAIREAARRWIERHEQSSLVEELWRAEIDRSTDPQIVPP